MKKSEYTQLFPIGRQVIMHAGWNDVSNSLVGQIGTVVDWKPFSIFENPNRNKVVFSDGSYVICDRDFLRPLLRDLVIDKFARTVLCVVRIARALQARFSPREGN